MTLVTDSVTRAIQRDPRAGKFPLSNVYTDRAVLAVTEHTSSYVAKDLYTMCPAARAMEKNS